MRLVEPPNRILGLMQDLQDHNPCFGWPVIDYVRLVNDSAASGLCPTLIGSDLRALGQHLERLMQAREVPSRGLGSEIDDGISVDLADSTVGYDSQLIGGHRIVIGIRSV